MLHQKCEITEKERKKLIDENEQLNNHILEIQTQLNIEIAKVVHGQ